MCGIVGAISKRAVVPILLEGLKRLEYRGYDSAGLVVLGHAGLSRRRALGKVQGLEDLLKASPIQGAVGIAHTRWATHGKPSTANAHPHICRHQVAIVHNGIIENHAQLRLQQIQQGFQFHSETDTEVVVNQIYAELKQTDSLLTAVRQTLSKLEGAYALGIIAHAFPDRLIACRKGSPLVIGVGLGEWFIASDITALLPVTQNFMFLEEGDIAEITLEKVVIYDKDFQIAERPIITSLLNSQAVDKGNFSHFMLKEIYEQPLAIQSTLTDRFIDQRLQDEAFGERAAAIFDQVKAVQILACGTSYHAGLVAKHWLEKIARIPCQIEVASEFRYRQPLLADDVLIVTISQSGETADTLAALLEAKRLGAKYSLVITNAPESALVRASDLVLLTHAGPEISVASTKSFTTQLAGLLLLVIALGRRFQLTAAMEAQITQELFSLPAKLQAVLQLDASIKQLAEQFKDKEHALFLGRGSHYPIAMEGALKLKEISYIHAEAYSAGELKHGPLALIDNHMPVVFVAPNNSLLEKLQSNIEEVNARGGLIFVFIDASLAGQLPNNIQVIKVPHVANNISPIIFSVLMQLLSYHVAILKGTDVDQPRNLAKSVTVE